MAIKYQFKLSNLHANRLGNEYNIDDPAISISIFNSVLPILVQTGFKQCQVKELLIGICICAAV